MKNDKFFVVLTMKMGGKVQERALTDGFENEEAAFAAAEPLRRQLFKTIEPAFNGTIYEMWGKPRGDKLKRAIYWPLKLEI